MATAGRQTAKRRAPARRPCQEIDGGIVVKGEHISTTEAGGVAQEIDFCQAEAVRERIVPDAGDIVGDRDAGQTGAALNAYSPMLVTLLGMCSLPAIPPGH